MVFNHQKRGVVIVGAGHAGVQTAASLRDFGYKNPITLIDRQVALPYQRPPLSKSFLHGNREGEIQHFKPHEWYIENSIDLLKGASVAKIDWKSRRVHFHDNRKISYSHLVLATGSTPRAAATPGAELKGIHRLHSLEDAVKLRHALTLGRRVVIIGGGFIGLELAATAIQRGAFVTILERSDRLLSRVTCPEVGAFFASEHRKCGVEICLNTDVAAFEGNNGVVSGVRLPDGKVVSCDLAVLGIGVEPNVDLAEGAGINTIDGIVVSSRGETSAPNVFAAGDCTYRPLAPYGSNGRLESVPNALEQARQVAATIAGISPLPDECPWFWSDQYDIKLQIAGINSGYDNVVGRGDPNNRSFAVFYLKNNVLIAVDAVNSPREFVSAKPLIMKQARPDLAQLSDPGAPLSELQSVSFLGLSSLSRKLGSWRAVLGGRRYETASNSIKAIFVDHHGIERRVDADIGGSLMEAAIKNNIPGIDADCGGVCACATCHVYVDEAFEDKLPEASDVELAMLEATPHRKPSSRLSCQIPVRPDLDGIRVSTPIAQR